MARRDGELDSFDIVEGRVSRLCPSLGPAPALVPAREPDFQAAIEEENISWRARVWARFKRTDLDGLIDRSSRHVAAWCRRRADRIESAPSRQASPKRWRLNLQALPQGRIIDVRRTDATGRA